MGQAAADGVDAFEKRKLILNHLIISSLVKLPSKSMLKTHLSTWICVNGAWTVHGNGCWQGWQVRSTCHHLLWAVTTSCSSLLLSVFPHRQHNNTLCCISTLWKYLVGSSQRSPGHCSCSGQGEWDEPREMLLLWSEWVGCCRCSHHSVGCGSCLVSERVTPPTGLEIRC